VNDSSNGIGITAPVNSVGSVNNLYQPTPSPRPLSKLNPGAPQYKSDPSLLAGEGNRSRSPSATSNNNNSSIDATMESLRRKLVVGVPQISTGNISPTKGSESLRFHRTKSNTIQLMFGNELHLIDH
jgi:hypothetical protein